MIKYFVFIYLLRLFIREFSNRKENQCLTDRIKMLFPLESNYCLPRLIQRKCNIIISCFCNLPPPPVAVRCQKTNSMAIGNYLSGFGGNCTFKVFNSWIQSNYIIQKPTSIKVP